MWTINGQTFASQNLSQVQAQFTTQRPDTVTFTQAAAYDAAPLYAYGTTVAIFRDQVQWFRGTVTAVQRRGSGNAERINYTVSGPWWQLQNIIYQQAYARYLDGIAANTAIARLILGTDATGARQNSAQVIAAAVAYAADQLGGQALFTLGTVEGATQMPYEELQALSCADVISRALRWNPDIVAYFDYTTPTPTLHFKRRSSLSSATLAHSDITITEASINSLNQLQRDGVIIQYERTDTIDGNEQKNIIIDEAGTTSNPLKTLQLFFDLQGSSLSYIRQSVKSESIQETSPTWWAKRHPKLQAATNITLTGGTKTPVDDEGENDGTDYSKELVSGSIAPWMIGVGVNDQLLKADVTYTPAGSSTPKTETLRLQVRGTNANDQIYSTLGESNPAEPTPVGLAAAILSGLSALQYEGTVSLTEPEAGSIPYIARTLNISGGRAEWQTMAAQIYQVTYNLDQGGTQISFGPAKHLGADQLYQLYRNVRTRKGSSGTIRTSSSGSDRDLPTKSPNTITADEGGGSGTPLAFTASIVPDSDPVELTITGGQYLVVNTPESVPALTATEGAFAYLRITHASTGVLDPSGPVQLVVSPTALDPVDLDATEAYIERSNCLIAAVVSGQIVQYRSGNASLIHTTVNGKICLWPYFEGGIA